MKESLQEVRFEFLNAIMNENKIPVHSVYLCMKNNKKDIKNIEKIFDSDDDLSVKKRLVLLKLISRNKA